MVVPLTPAKLVGVILIFPLSSLKVPATVIDFTGDVLIILVSEKVDPLNTSVSLSAELNQVPCSGVFVVVVFELELLDDESEPPLHAIRLMANKAIRQ